MPTENVIMPERYTHRTGQNFLIQNDIKGFKKKDKTHMKRTELEKHSNNVTIKWIILNKRELYFKYKG